jgi:outer membrane lipoprotein-sorting protein
MFRRPLSYSLFLFLFASLLMAADAQTAAPKLTAAQIIDKAVAAQGGLQAWRSVQTMLWSGKVDAGAGDSAERSRRYVQKVSPATAQQAPVVAPDGADKSKQVQLPFVMKMKRGRKSRMELQFAGKTALQVYDGSNGWKVRPFLNRTEVEPFTADESKAQAQESDLDGPLVDYAAKGTTAELDGVEKVGGRDAYKLKLTMKSGQVQHVWVDAQNFLEVKIEGTPRRMDGKMHPVFIYLRDYKPVQGLMVPHVFETAVEGYKETHKMVIESVVVNPKLDDSLFAKPQVR